MKKLIIKILTITIIFWALFTFVFGLHRVSGNSMFPALKDGDLCITYKLDKYRSQDVVIYKRDGKVKAGRILGVGPDSVSISGQQVALNGAIVSEEIMYPTEINETSGIQYPVQLFDGSYFILNDYRPDMNDSRTIGPVYSDELHGKLIFVLRRRGF